MKNWTYNHIFKMTKILITKKKMKILIILSNFFGDKNNLIVLWVYHLFLWIRGLKALYEFIIWPCQSNYLTLTPNKFWHIKLS
jgi:hypothetical protein